MYSSRDLDTSLHKLEVIYIGKYTGIEMLLEVLRHAPINRITIT